MMKTKILILLLSFNVAAGVAGKLGQLDGLAKSSKKTRMIVAPDFGLSPYASNTIDSIALSDKETVLYCTLAMYSKKNGGWRSVDLPLYIQANGKRYSVTSYEGFVPGKQYRYDDAPDGLHYVLHFPAIPKNTKTIDFIGDTGDNEAWQLFDIRLDGKTNPQRDLVPDAVRKEAESASSDDEAIPVPTWCNDTATVVIKYYGYRKELGSTVDVDYQNPIEMKRYTEKLTLSDDGTAVFRIPIVSSHAVVRVSSFYFRGNMIVSAGKESVLHVDMVKRGHIRTNLKEHKWPDGRFFWCTGVNADLNNLLMLEKKEKQLAAMQLTDRQRSLLQFYEDADDAADLLEGMGRIGRKKPFRHMDELPINDSRLLLRNTALSKIISYGRFLATSVVTDGSLSNFGIPQQVEKVRSGELQRNFQKATGYGEGFITDLIVLESYKFMLNEGRRLTDEELQPLKALGNPLFYNYIVKKNNEMQDMFAERPKAPGHKEFEMNNLDAILRHHEGRNIVFAYVPAGGYSVPELEMLNDFIAEMEEQGTDFCFIPSFSDKTGWHNYTKGINGYHYWMSIYESFELNRKLTGENAVCTLDYIFLSKDGKKAENWSKHNSISKLRKVTERAKSIKDYVLKNLEKK